MNRFALVLLALSLFLLSANFGSWNAFASHDPGEAHCMIGPGTNMDHPVISNGDLVVLGNTITCFPHQPLSRDINLQIVAINPLGDIAADTGIANQYADLSFVADKAGTWTVLYGQCGEGEAPGLNCQGPGGPLDTIPMPLSVLVTFNIPGTNSIQSHPSTAGPGENVQIELCAGDQPIHVINAQIFTPTLDSFFDVFAEIDIAASSCHIWNTNSDFPGLTTNQPGIYVVQVDTSQTTLTSEFGIPFSVVPESMIGTIALVASSLGSLVAFKKIRKNSRGGTKPKRSGTSLEI